MQKEARMRRSDLEGPRERQPIRTHIQQRLTRLAPCRHYRHHRTHFFPCRQSVASIMEVHCRFYLIFNFLINTKKCFWVKIPNNINIEEEEISTVWADKLFNQEGPGRKWTFYLKTEKEWFLRKSKFIRADTASETARKNLWRLICCSNMEDLMDFLKENPGRGPIWDVKSLDILRPFDFI